MSNDKLSKLVTDFIFEYIDSVEQLEILVLLDSDSKSWSATELSDHFRSNINSVEKRLELLNAQGLVKKSENGTYSFANDDATLRKSVRDLREAYKSHRHVILELIFSPVKKCRDFAEAFKLSPSKNRKGNKKNG